jgi:hypothetical protein
MASSAVLKGFLISVWDLMSTVLYCLHFCWHSGLLSSCWIQLLSSTCNILACFNKLLQIPPANQFQRLVNTWSDSPSNNPPSLVLIFCVCFPKLWPKYLREQLKGRNYLHWLTVPEGPAHGCVALWACTAEGMCGGGYSLPRGSREREREREKERDTRDKIHSLKTCPQWPIFSSSS